MQTVRAITISAGKPVQAVPTGGVIFLSILKDLYEDMKRHRQDAEENNQKAMKWNGSKFEEVKWFQIRVGDIIMIE
jgi:phospholipid-transporting ATPase